MGHFNDMYLDNCDRRTSDDDLLDRRDGVSSAPSMFAQPTYTKTLTPAFEQIGRRKRMTGVLAEVFDGTTLIHSQEYPNYSEAERVTNALVYDLLSSPMAYSVAELDGGAEPEDNDPPEEGPCDDINIPEPDRPRAAVI